MGTEVIAIKVAKRIRVRLNIFLVLFGMSTWEQVRSHVLRVVLVTGSCRSPFFDLRRMETMQPARHLEKAEKKESDRKNRADCSAK